MRYTRRNEAAFERATQLLDALIDKNLPESLQKEIREWFASDMNTTEKYDALKKLFVDLKPNLDPDGYEYEQYRQICRQLGFRDNLSKPKPKTRKVTTFRRFLRYVAILLPVAAIIGTAIYLWNTRDATIENYPIANVLVSVGANGQKRIVLPDGSQVWLNSSSQLSYNDDFSAERFVKLSGEGFFSITPNNALPFRVKTNNMMVEVLGTEFNIKAHSNTTTSEVVLASGSLRVTARKKSCVLAPNQRLTLDITTSEISIDKVRSELFCGWTLKKLHFVDTPLEAALQDIAAYYGRELKFADGWKKTDDLITLTLDHEVALEQLLPVVRNITGSFNYEITAQHIIIKHVQ